MKVRLMLMMDSVIEERVMWMLLLLVQQVKRRMKMICLKDSGLVKGLHLNWDLKVAGVDVDAVGDEKCDVVVVAAAVGGDLQVAVNVFDG